MRRIVLLIMTIMTVPVLGTVAVAQEVSEMRDSIRASVKIDRRPVYLATSQHDADLESIARILSPTGEGDPLKWTQTLPGVTTGADGSSSFFVRGGNMGNNLITLDGVPVYGYSHLLGLAAVIPQNIISSATLSKGGFDGGDGNFTSSHLSIATRLPDTTSSRTTLSAGNFIVSAVFEKPLSDRLSMIASARVSPLSLEYKAARSLLADALSVDNFGAGVGDVYVKLHKNIRSGSSWDISALGSLDRYSFNTSDGTYHSMGWDNGILIFNWNTSLRKGSLALNASYNGYGNTRSQDADYRGRETRFSVDSRVQDLTVGVDRYLPSKGGFDISYGAKAREALFNPGDVDGVDNKSYVTLATAYFRTDYNAGGAFSAAANLRGNLFLRSGTTVSYLDPDLSLSARWKILPSLTFEASLDHINQYYHTLEGLPTGWSLDLLVPSGADVRPERADQAAGGLALDLGRDRFNAGAFYKRMDGLVHYKGSTDLFDAGLAGWESSVELGEGSSYGLETMYEHESDDLYVRISYTFSHTDRKSFPTVGGGKPFHARYDRTHVLNAYAGWKNVSAAFIYQSGHWETGDSDTYPMHLPHREFDAEYYSGINNYRMPAVIRLDLGYSLGWKGRKAEHHLNLGVCNVLNRFNPFLLWFDTSSGTWKEIALLPVMPNFSYSISL